MWSKIVGALKELFTLFTGLGQVVQGNTVVTKVSDFLTQAVGVINDVENIAQKLGDAALTPEQKLQAAVALLTQDVLAHPALEGHKVQDPALFAKAMSEFAQGAFDLQKSLSGGGVETVNKSA